MRALIVLLAVAALAVAPVAAQQKAPKSPAAKSAPTAGAPLNINTATPAQLETLPGLGKAVAERIVEYREKNGNFKKVEDLMNVKGIGEKSFLKLKPLITVTQKADPSGL